MKSFFTLEISDGKLCNYTTGFGVCMNCSANGGQGFQTRTTTCNCPPPSNGGANCTSSGQPNTTLSSDSTTETQTRACTTCPVGRLFKIPFQLKRMNVVQWKIQIFVLICMISSMFCQYLKNNNIFQLTGKLLASLPKLRESVEL